MACETFQDVDLLESFWKLESNLWVSPSIAQYSACLVILSFLIVRSVQLKWRKVRETSLVFFCVASICCGGFSFSSFITVVFFTVFFFFWLVELPFMLLLDGPLKRSVMVASSVVADAGAPPEVVNSEGAEDHPRVVELMVVADPGSDHSPEVLVGRVSSESSDLDRFADYHDQMRC